MSNTIQTRNYTARQAALLQLRPSALIDAAEHVEARQTTTVRVMYDYEPPAANISVGAVGHGVVKALTAGTKFSLVTTDWPTTAPVLLVDLDDVQASNWTRWAGQAKDALQKAATGQKRPFTAAARLRVERLAAVQAAFGFTTQDFAAVLGLSRQGLYKWLDEANEVKLQDASRQRLATVERIAKEWRERSNAPLTLVAHEPLAAGGNVFERLTANEIDEAAVLGAFDELMAKLQAKPKTRSQRLSEAGFKGRASARSLPSDE